MARTFCRRRRAIVPVRPLVPGPMARSGPSRDMAACSLTGAIGGLRVPRRCPPGDRRARGRRAGRWRWPRRSSRPSGSAPAARRESAADSRWRATTTPVRRRRAVDAIRASSRGQAQSSRTATARAGCRAATGAVLGAGRHQPDAGRRAPAPAPPPGAPRGPGLAVPRLRLITWTPAVTAQSIAASSASTVARSSRSNTFTGTISASGALSRIAAGDRRAVAQPVDAVDAEAARRRRRSRPRPRRRREDATGGRRCR